MRSNQKEYWKNAIRQMDPNNQLDLTNILIEELELNEHSLDETDGYDMEMSHQLRLILERFSREKNSKIEKGKVIDLLARFNKLPSNLQKKVIDDIGEDFINSIEKAIKEDNITKCSENGHAFENVKWDIFEWTTKEEGYQDRQTFMYDLKHTMWGRKCPKCGFIEESDFEPKELYEKRIAKEKQAKIKELKLQIKEIEEN